MEKNMDFGAIDINELLNTKTLSFLDRDGIYEDTGYKYFTNFYEAFSIVDLIGKDAIKNKYATLVSKWKNDYIFITELAVTLLLKRDEWGHKHNDEYFDIYDELIEDIVKFVFHQCQFSEEQLEYFHDVIETIVKIS